MNDSQSLEIIIFGESTAKKKEKRVESQHDDGGWSRRGEVQTPKGQVAGQERSHCISDQRCRVGLWEGFGSRENKENKRKGK